MMAPIYRIAPKVFGAAAIYGVIALVPLYFAEFAPNAEPITRPEFFYGFIGASLCFQAIYWLIARNPLIYKPFMLLGIACKLSFAIPVALLYLGGRVGELTLLFGAIDFVLATLFLYCWRLAP